MRNGQSKLRFTWPQYLFGLTRQVLPWTEPLVVLLGFINTESDARNQSSVRKQTGKMVDAVTSTPGLPKVKLHLTQFVQRRRTILINCLCTV